MPQAERTFTFEEAKALVRRATAPLGPDYQRALETALTRRWVDVYPNRGKQSGAYCTDHAYGFHPYVKLNYDGTYGAVSTLAHELGHAMHSFFGPGAALRHGRLPHLPRGDRQHLQREPAHAPPAGHGRSDAYKLYVLDNYLEQLRGTIYRQGLFADFELAMHEHVEQGQSLSPEWLDKTYLDLTRLYYGHDLGVVKVDDWIQSEWSEIPHFYMNFYVFQYTTSMAASMALSEAVLKEGEPARARYLQFLGARRQQVSPGTLKAAGVDFTTPQPMVDALQAFDRLVGELEALWYRVIPKERQG